MREAKIIGESGEKIYLVTIEFVTPRKTSYFKKGFYASSIKELQEHIDSYLLEYYGLKRIPGSESLIYRDDDMYASILFWEEITGVEELKF